MPKIYLVARLDFRNQAKKGRFCIHENQAIFEWTSLGASEFQTLSHHSRLILSNYLNWLCGTGKRGRVVARRAFFFFFLPRTEKIQPFLFEIPCIYNLNNLQISAAYCDHSMNLYIFIALHKKELESGVRLEEILKPRSWQTIPRNLNHHGWSRDAEEIGVQWSRRSHWP